MAINPFELIKAFGNLQERMGEIQEKLRRIQATGSAGGQMVQVVMNGQLEVVRISIAAEVVDPIEVTMLEDLVRAAFSDALLKIKEKIREEMASIPGAGGLM